MSKLVYYIIYPLLWVFYPPLVKARFSEIKENKALWKAFKVCASLAFILLAFPIALLAAHIGGDVFGDMERAIVTGAPPAESESQRQQRESDAVLPPPPVANETVYDTEDNAPTLNSQARIDALKEKVNAERGNSNDK